MGRLIANRWFRFRDFAIQVNESIEQYRVRGLAGLAVLISFVSKYHRGNHPESKGKTGIRQRATGRPHPLSRQCLKAVTMSQADGLLTGGRHRGIPKTVELIGHLYK